MQLEVVFKVQLILGEVHMLRMIEVVLWLTLSHLRGDYAADQALYTVEADAYEPNDYNLYNMAGNVAEWVDTSYDPASYEYMSSINPNVNDSSNDRKVIRGGSWKDVAYFLQVSSRDYEYADSARSYIGFRTVQDYMGEDVTSTEFNN